GEKPILFNEGRLANDKGTEDTPTRFNDRRAVRRTRGSRRLGGIASGLPQDDQRRAPPAKPDQRLSGRSSIRTLHAAAIRRNNDLRADPPGLRRSRYDRRPDEARPDLCDRLAEPSHRGRQTRIIREGARSRRPWPGQDRLSRNRFLIRAIIPPFILLLLLLLGASRSAAFNPACKIKPIFALRFPFDL